MSIPQPLTPRAAAFARLAERDTGATVCPSEIARAVASGRDGREPDWRSLMPEVHAEVDALVLEGLVCLSWKGRDLPVRAGPYRIRSGAPGPVTAGD